MNVLPMFAAALVAGVLSAPVAAQTPAVAAASAQIKRNDRITSVDGKRIGKVYSVRRDNGGAGTALVIYGQRFVTVPLSTITAGEKGYVTSLTLDQVRGRR